MPLNIRPFVLEDAFARTLSDQFCAWFLAEFGAADSSGDPLPTMLISGEIADQVVDLYTDDRRR